MTTVREIIQSLIAEGVNLDDEVIAKKDGKRIRNVDIIVCKEGRIPALGSLFG
jgi:hypothetical protein